MTARRAVGRRVRVGVLASSMAWRPAFVAHASEHVGVVDVTTIRGPHVVGRPDVVVVDATVSFVDELTANLASGVQVVGVYSSTDADDTMHRLRACGVRPQHLVADSDPPSALIDLVVRLAADAGIEATAPRSTVRSDAAGQQPDGLRRLGNVLAVGGPDASLATEVVGGLAAALATHGRTMVLDLQPARLVASRFGVQLQPNVCDAVRALASRRDLDLVSFAPWRGVCNVQLPFWTLPGAPTVGASRALRPNDRNAVLAAAADQFVSVVSTLDWAPDIVDQPTSSVLDRCAQLAVCVRPSPAAVPRLLDWLGDLRERHETLPEISLIMAGRANRARRDQIDDELHDCLAEFGTVERWYLPLQQRQLVDAEWRGDLLGGAFRRGCRRIVGDLIAEGYDDAALPVADDSEDADDSGGDETADTSSALSDAPPSTSSESGGDTEPVAVGA